MIRLRTKKQIRSKFKQKRGVIVTITITLLLTLQLSLNAQTRLPITPYPNSVIVNSGELTVDNISIKIKSKAADGVAEFTIKELESRFSIKESRDGTPLTLKISKKIDNSEGYTLDITSKGITIVGATDNGLFYGVESLIQLLYFNINSNSKPNSIPLCSIKDEPRFAWRGYMLDESRHFFGKEKVLNTLDLMALHKLNKFHWHLTDAAGWRLEIKKYPKLTSIGSIGCHTDPDSPAAYYTQEEIREVIEYAKERFIEVIPEIDMPGHASAASLAYPEISGGGSETHPNFTFNPGNPFTYQFLTDILTEVAALFPSEYIHVGGDEVHFGNKKWNSNEGVKEIMRENSFTNLVDVENYFMRRMGDTITALNRKLIGWDEIASSGVDKNQSLIMWWRHDKPEILKSVLDNSYATVLCPRVPMYFDFLQEREHKNGRSWGGSIVEIESVYNFPDKLDIDIDNSSVVGIQANMWSERTKSEQSLDFLVWPRLSAMAVASWTKEENKDFNSFTVQMKNLFTLYDKYGIYYYNMFNKDKHIEHKNPGESRWQERHKE